MTEVKKHAGGRPPQEFNPEWCDMLIKHGGGGLSPDSFAGVISVAIETLHRLFERNPEFLAAKKISEAKCRLFWEMMGRSGSAGKIQYFNAGTWIFNMKNRFGWRDVKELEMPQDLFGKNTTLTIKHTDKNGKEIK